MSVVSYRNSTSNHNLPCLVLQVPEVVSYRNSTSNHNPRRLFRKSVLVVSYRNSTSNHNKPGLQRERRIVVSYRNSTSNHNSAFVIESVTPLYLIEILHQTTTALLTLSLVVQLYLIEILHQTTTVQIRNDKGEGCILSKFYIKPQHVLDSYAARYGCILSKFYIKPQLSSDSFEYGSGCILSKFYIKPQPLNWDSEVDVVVSYRNSTSNHNKPGLQRERRIVVSYRNSTSNHNFERENCFVTPLYLIEILHQTTTGNSHCGCSLCCILSKFYIKPQQTAKPIGIRRSCILSKFYIKPQHYRRFRSAFRVVSYRNSTSNHNR